MSGAIQTRLVEVLRTIFDPEIPVNIHDLGLVYETNLDDEGHLEIVMTVTAPGCPVSDFLVSEVETKAAGVEGVCSVKVRLVWEPAWDPSMATEAAQLELGWF